MRDSTMSPDPATSPVSAACPRCGVIDRQARRQQTMAIKAPSPAQLDYLQALGDDGPPPANMREAAERLDTLKRGEVQP